MISIEPAAWRITEQDAPGHYALITDVTGQRPPVDPNTDKIHFAVYTEIEDEESSLWTGAFSGRADLIKWYVNNVGYDPDQDNGEPEPVLELLDRVVSMILLRDHADRAQPHANRF